MPTYVKTIMYKIECKNNEITECYIGHTTNPKSRQAEHKYNCNNEKSKGHNLRLYSFIRANGGWDNWDMIEIEKYPCNSKREAETREHYWYFELKSTLNVISPILDLEKRIANLNRVRDEEKAKSKIRLEERKQKRIIYLEENKDIILQHQKNLRLANAKANRESINEKMRNYNKLTAERRKELAKKYYEKRKANGYYVKHDD